MGLHRIGDFAKITNLSIRTLRFYDELGLLVPEEVDVYSNYRYYGDRNIEEAKKINYYKKAGFTLEEIRDHWNNFTDEDYLSKKKELYQKIDILNEQIKLVDLLRSQNEHTNKSVKVKTLGGRNEL